MRTWQAKRSAGDASRRCTRSLKYPIPLRKKFNCRVNRTLGSHAILYTIVLQSDYAQCAYGRQSTPLATLHRAIHDLSSTQTLQGRESIVGSIASAHYTQNPVQSCLSATMHSAYTASKGNTSRRRTQPHKHPVPPWQERNHILTLHSILYLPRYYTRPLNLLCPPATPKPTYIPIQFI